MKQEIEKVSGENTGERSHWEDVVFPWWRQHRYGTFPNVFHLLTLKGESFLPITDPVPVGGGEADQQEAYFALGFFPLDTQEVRRVLFVRELSEHSCSVVPVSFARPDLIPGIAPNFIRHLAGQIASGRTG